MEELQKELEDLEQREFMLQMCDHWDSSDYRLEDELCEKIKDVKKRISEMEVK